MAKKRYKIKLPLFVRLYDFVLQDSNLTNREKLVLCTAFRYWPEANDVSFPPQTTITDKTLTKMLRYKDKTSIEKILKILDDKGYIQRTTVTRQENGEYKSRRVMEWIKFPVPAKQRVGHPPNSGVATPQTATEHPPNSGPTIKDNNYNYKKAMPTPLPADGQASALPRDSKKNTKSSGLFRRGKPHKPLTAEQESQQRQKLSNDIIFLKNRKKQKQYLTYDNRGL